MSRRESHRDSATTKRDDVITSERFLERLVMWNDPNVAAIDCGVAQVTLVEQIAPFTVGMPIRFRNRARR